MVACCEERESTWGLLEGAFVSFRDVFSSQLQESDGFQADGIGHFTRWVTLFGSGDGQ